jgi:hypothetical protein
LAATCILGWLSQPDSPTWLLYGLNRKLRPCCRNFQFFPAALGPDCVFRIKPHRDSRANRPPIRQDPATVPPQTGHSPVWGNERCRWRTKTNSPRRFAPPDTVLRFVVIEWIHSLKSVKWSPLSSPIRLLTRLQPKRPNRRDFRARGGAIPSAGCN